MHLACYQGTCIDVTFCLVLAQPMHLLDIPPCMPDLLRTLQPTGKRMSSCRVLCSSMT